MNLLLQDPFSVLKEYPEKLTFTLENPLRTECLEFSTCGNYLALGCSNGDVVIYDMDTLRPITVLGSESGAHVRSVQSLSWSPDGRYIITGSRDWCVKLWDLNKPERPYRETLFEGPIWNCKWLDAENLRCVATVSEEDHVFMIDFNHETPIIHQIRIEEDIESNKGHVLTCCVNPNFPDVIITGTSKGWLSLLKIDNHQMDNNAFTFSSLYSTKIVNSNIKDIIISQNGDRLAVNSSDRTIRQYAVQMSEDLKFVTVDLEHRYQDVINKLQWNCIFFSNGSAEYLVASTHGSSTRELYLWETGSGTLVRVLEGAEEELMDINWNFYNMCIASNGFESGYVYIWSIVIPPKWSALAPDFEEIEENIEYQEKEDEFDQVGELEQQHELIQAEEVPIDLTTKERYDVRGNDLLRQDFVIPMDYQRILLMHSKK
ncbi:COMPASS subunit protein SWD1 NDAI_0J01840 [Naumovozyma dairenensis CBS 421]|uniref:Uncharacterized protein n=1 Tax=Naumovozyma dairenensis (strain ATCC 10597 / BCRC 20456 / CBS 421 / NBRC 0211 / NRRL Y-12639) TaxID=1071378 RepID=G0WGZ8_NAUDC|nr:hypothetical protein NDAI_0J01840 [Naumovozyma dairenensis CBS 421]CCD27076.1 hypothetical protein NDAI_0J01840 [Naumovozyma dairenensis CBS 421]